MLRWVLPEYIQDALPAEAAKLEDLRRRLLDAFRLNGYQLVAPPLLEYLESLLTGAGQDLQLKTLKLGDQLSGRTMGVRADITTQVARIDAMITARFAPQATRGDAGRELRGVVRVLRGETRLLAPLSPRRGGLSPRKRPSLTPHRPAAEAIRTGHSVRPSARSGTRR